MRINRFMIVANFIYKISNIIAIFHNIVPLSKFRKKYLVSFQFGKRFFPHKKAKKVFKIRLILKALLWL